MPKPAHRSRTLRRVKVTTPAGENKIHYKKRKPQKAKCGKCGTILKAVPRERPHIMRNLPKSSKRPERPYGGVLCSKCAREEFKRQAND